MRAFLACAAVLAGFGAAPLSAAPEGSQAQDYQSIVSELLAADRGHAQLSAKVDLAEGLSAMFDAETVMVIPGGFARGKAAITTALKANPANVDSRASWTPVRGGVSADGRHGFTLGFMTISSAGKPDRKAKYLSYWVKKPDGWRVAVYKRGGRPDGDVSLDMMPPSLPEAALKAASDASTLEAYRASLDKAERAFSDLAQKVGLGPAFVENGRPDATNAGSGPGFTVGNEKIGADVGRGGGPGVTWAPDGGVIVAATGDLGITWGLIHPNQPKEGQPTAFPYTTVWRRAGPDQPWKYIAE